MPGQAVEEKSLHLSRPDIQARGWTPRLMRLYLPEPEGSVRSSYSYSRRIPTWSPETIEAIESKPDFKDARDALERRRAAGRAKAETVAARRREREKILEREAVAAAMAYEIVITVWPLAKVRRHAIDAYNDRSLSCGEFRERATVKSDPSFLMRISKNFVRHRLSNYDEIIRRYAAEHRSAEGSETLKRRVYDEIDLAYPGFDEKIKALAG